MSEFTFDQYSETAEKTAIYPKVFVQQFPDLNGGTLNTVGFVYPALGLVSEAGEIAGKLKKVIRDNKGVLTEEVRNGVVKECGDCLWYLALLLKELDSSLAYAAKANNVKLLDRLDRGVIQGSGDER